MEAEPQKVPQMLMLVPGNSGERALFAGFNVRGLVGASITVAFLTGYGCDPLRLDARVAKWTKR